MAAPPRSGAHWQCHCRDSGVTAANCSAAAGLSREKKRLPRNRRSWANRRRRRLCSLRPALRPAQRAEARHPAERAPAGDPGSNPAAAASAAPLLASFDNTRANWLFRCTGPPCHGPSHGAGEGAAALRLDRGPGRHQRHAAVTLATRATAVRWPASALRCAVGCTDGEPGFALSDAAFTGGAWHPAPPAPAHRPAAPPTGTAPPFPT